MLCWRRWAGHAQLYPLPSTVALRSSCTASLVCWFHQATRPPGLDPWRPYWVIPLRPAKWECEAGGDWRRDSRRRRWSLVSKRYISPREHACFRRPSARGRPRRLRHRRNRHYTSNRNPDRGHSGAAGRGRLPRYRPLHVRHQSSAARPPWWTDQMTAEEYQRMADVDGMRSEALNVEAGCCRLYLS